MRLVGAVNTSSSKLSRGSREMGRCGLHPARHLALPWKSPASPGAQRNAP